MATKPFWNRRRGVAMILVLLLGIVILVLGTAMITTSGGFFQSTVDAKQRLRSRYAAEAMVALQMATLEKLKDSLMAGKLNLAAVPATQVSPTGNGEMAQAGSVKQTTGGQQVVNTGDFKGLMGTKVSFLVKSTGTAPGGAKTNVQATLYLYQIPLFQFGVFYQGNLEIDPGPVMHVLGPVHTNGNAYFRAWSDLATTGHSLYIQGPVTVAGNIYQWVMGPPDGSIYYYHSPDSAPAANQFQAGLTHNIAAMGSNRPGPSNGKYNIDYGTPQLNLPIGGSVPHDLIMPCTGSESPALKNQKFDCLTDAGGRFINGRTAQPSWIPTDSVFFDRREDRWVHVWCVNVAALPAGDSIFYLYDSVLMAQDRGARHDTVINAFKLYNAAHLTRNLSIATGNPVYVEGNFNAGYHGGPCKPLDWVGTVPDSEKYCNTMIACDAFTLLSPTWSHENYAAKDTSGSLEQKFSNASWLTGAETENPTGYTGAFGLNDTLNAAILTGEKPTDSLYLYPWTTNTTNNYFEGKYEGGWHNTIRFLENWNTATSRFRGSFVCMWSAETPGLRMKYDSTVFSTRYYSPPNRDWGFDPRFADINNMPPGTPFLSTGIYYNWLQSQ